MCRIDTLQIYNFKFFDSQDPIKLAGKHLLLYGENGSGKSSIYRGLNTLFEAAQKEKSEIQKCFKHHTQSEESLVNIHAESIYTGESVIYNSFIEVETTHEVAQKYTVSFFDTGINENLIAKEINQSSDFISYKVLYKFQDFLNDERMDLAKIFIDDILPYITFPAKQIIRNGQPLTVTNAAEMYREISHGPGTTINGKGKKIQVYKFSLENRTFNDFAQHFSEQMVELVDFINANAPAMLKKLGYDIDFFLSYKPSYHKKFDVRFEFIPFKLEFTITSYLGEKIRIARPHSFLNEAKIAAIAIAIRLTTLKKRINEAAPDLLKFIVFDDVMISLDMNNRDRLIDFLLDPTNKFMPDYQWLFLTHDRSLFFYLKDKIRNAGLKDEFVYKEMYVDAVSDIQKPAIYESPNKLQKAKYYLERHDYPACGIYLRTMCEEILDRIYPPSLKNEVSINTDGNQETRPLNLNGKINNLEHFCIIEKIDYQPFKDLRTYKSVVLNSLAHHDIYSPLYRVELEKVYKVLVELNHFKRDIQLLKQSKTLAITFAKADGNPYVVGITLKDTLVLLEGPRGVKRISNFCKTNITYLSDNGIEIRNVNIERESISQIVEEKCAELGIDMINIPAATIYRGQRSLAEIISDAN